MDHVVGYLTCRLPVQRKAQPIQGIISNNSLRAENQFNALKGSLAGAVQVIQVSTDDDAGGIFKRIPAMIPSVTALPAIVVEQ